MAPKTTSPVAARAELDARQETDNTDENLKAAAKEQEKTQADELAAGAKAKPGAHQENIDNDNVAAARRSSGFNGNGAQSGFIDQISRVHGDDALEGHFVTIDLNNKGVQDAFKTTKGLEDHKGDYGVYMEPGDLDPDTGRPLTALVRLRDETNALVALPYEALTAATARGR